MAKAEIESTDLSLFIAWVSDDLDDHRCVMDPRMVTDLEDALKRARYAVAKALRDKKA